MTNQENFSRRHGLCSINEKEIVVREDAPQHLRDFIRMTFYALNKNPSDLRDITTRFLKNPPDKNN